MDTIYRPDVAGVSAFGWWDAGEIDNRLPAGDNCRMFQLKPYADANGHEPFSDWYRALRDRKLKKAVDRRMQRAELGNFGDCKPCQDGVWELRIDLGPGHRVYYALDGKTVVLLLCAGSKRTQQADIAKASVCWKDWQERHTEEGNDDE